MYLRRTKPTSVSNRAGLILLVVLGMLALFSMLAITYVVLTSQARIANFGMAHRDQHPLPDAEVLDLAMKEALRGSRDSLSTISAHSLLADLYGHTEYLSPTAIADRNIAIQSDSFLLQNASIVTSYLVIPLQPGPVSPGFDIPYDDYYTGRLVTFTAVSAGIHRGWLDHSFRIVRSFARGSSIRPNSIVIDLSEIDRDELIASLPTAGSEVLINARELNGLGYGIPYNMASIADGQRVTRYGAPPFDAPPIGPIDVVEGLAPRAQSEKALTIQGDSDEPYDAPDFNDFWLAYRDLPTSEHSGILPSYHRAGLINYLVEQAETSLPNPHDWSSATISEIAAILTKIEAACGRPLSYRLLSNTTPDFSVIREQNSGFDGSNQGKTTGAVHVPTLELVFDSSSFDLVSDPETTLYPWFNWLTNGPWDVDNDLDGLEDSVWVDPDLPLATSPDGKLLKVLAAYFIEDLDGRLDVNAVGNLAQGSSLDVNYGFNAANDSRLEAYSSPTPPLLPLGSGIGSAEISLRHFLTNQNDYVSNFLERRYGGVNSGPGIDGSTALEFRSLLDAGGLNPATSIFGTGGVRHTHNWRTASGIPRNVLPGLPSDSRGAWSIELDLLGNPTIRTVSQIWNSATNYQAGARILYASTPYLCIRSHSNFEPTVATNWNNYWVVMDDRTQSPYESRVASSGRQDQLFSIPDWERIYRVNDWDRSSLPADLEFLASHAQSITPRSSHLRFVPLSGKATSNTPMRSLRELMYALIVERLGSSPPVADEWFRELFPEEFQVSRAMNVNRSFGNGTDDDNDGSIDEPNEIAAGESPISLDMSVTPARLFKDTSVSLDLIPNYISRTDPALDAVFADRSNPGSFFTFSAHNGQQSRQLFARNLYCLAMLMMPDPLYASPSDASGATGLKRARTLAQWAVNVVDFRDADHAMTRFPFDPTPFADNFGTGSYWDPRKSSSNNIECHVVWGMEQPELLLQESLAFHDLRQIEDPDDPGSGNMKQYRVPQGSLFLELLCPRIAPTSVEDAESPGVSSSMYTNAGGQMALDLSRLSPPDRSDTNYPVWRIAISEPNSAALPSSEIQYQLDQDRVDDATAEQGDITSTVTAVRSSDLYFAPYETTTRTAEADIDRIVWFVDATTYGTGAAATQEAARAAVGLNVTGTDRDKLAHVYWPSGSNHTLSGGQYMVIGPREVTYLGSKSSGITSHTNQPSNHRIVLADASYPPFDVANDTAGNPFELTNWVGIIEHNNVGRSRPLVSGQIGVRDVKTLVASTNVQTDSWISATTSATSTDWDDLEQVVGLNVSCPHPVQTGFYEVPKLRTGSTDATGDSVNGAPGYRFTPTSPGPGGFFNYVDGYRDFSTGTGTLPDPQDQRTGFPLESVSAGAQEGWCTAYLQRLADPDRPWHATFNPYITVDDLTIDLTIFNGFEDDGAAPPSYGLASRSKDGGSGTIKSFLSDAPVPGTPRISAASTTAIFEEQLPLNGFSLGLLNQNIGTILDWSSHGLASTSPYVGAPETTPAMLTWFNRNFSSQHELMLVPYVSPGRLNRDFNAEPAITSFDQDQPNSFRYLLNFREYDGTFGLAAAALFDLTETNSPWSDTSTLVNPLVAQTFGNELSPYRAPYNRIPRFREPGRVNLNTLRSQEVLNGILHGYDQDVGSVNWNDFRDTRGGELPATSAFTGYTTPNTILARIPDFATEFAGIFKPSLAVGRVPSDAGASSTAADYHDNSAASPSSQTILRHRHNHTSTALFPNRLTTLNPSPYREYLPISRLTNLTSTRSNVFAVRITVGFFEYDPRTGLGPEYGATEGKITRHRGFYVIDRSIPVAFEPGEDHNTENCVIVRRILE